MFDVLSTNHYIIIFSSIIIISYFFNSYSKKKWSALCFDAYYLGNGVWFLYGVSRSIFFYFRGFGNCWFNFNCIRRSSWVKTFEKANIPIIFKSFAVSAVTLGGSSYLGALS